MKPQKKPVKLATALKPAAKASSRRNRKVLVVAHNHPQFFPGGAEIIAYDLFNAFKNIDGITPFFMAGVAGKDRKVHTGTPFQTLSTAEDEILFWGDAFDYFYQSQQIASFMYNDFAEFLRKTQPDIIHFHHTMRIGIEALQVARNVLPGVKIVYTLHEFILMCNHNGQMVRTFNNELCDKATPSRCHQCYPDIFPGQFMMRESFLKSHLNHVDLFISPSHFLAERFIEWGIPQQKMRVQENGREVVSAAPFRSVPRGGKRNVFGYFGQINPYKGAMLTLAAAESLIRKGVTDFRLELFGNIEQQTEEFQKKFFKKVEKYKDNITFHGKYRNQDIPGQMQQVDWVIVPSTWWENSPLVIQEAFMHKRPILCSNIGGMAEKVKDGVNGLHFQARSEQSLARAIERAASDSDLWETFTRAIGPRTSIEECAAEHVAFYNALCA